MLAMIASSAPIPTRAQPTATPTVDNTALAGTVAALVQTATAAVQTAFAQTAAAIPTQAVTADASAQPLPQTAQPLEADTAQGTAAFDPTGTPFIPIAITPTVTLIPPLLPTALPDPALRSFQLSGAGDGEVIQFPFEVGVVRFTRNPVNPNQYMTVTTAGTLVFIPDFQGGAATRIYAAPFTDYTYQVQSRADNNAAVDDARWSPDGSIVAYIVNGDRESFDGVWMWSPAFGDLGQYVRDCPPEPGCLLVAYRENPAQWESRSIAWSPDSRALLVRLWIPGEERFGFMIAEVALRNPERNEPRWIAYRYAFAHWTLDSGAVLVSGRGPDGVVAIRRLDRRGRTETILYEAPGMWLQDAVDLGDGRIAFFASTGERAPLTMFTWENGGVVRAITPTIGTGGAERIVWNPGRTAALLVIPEEYNSVFYKRYYIAGIDGTVREITVDVAGALAVEWVGG
jgi:hypothetical protein